MSYLRIRNCPQCDKELKYTNKSCYCTAKKRNSLCATCAAKNRDNTDKFLEFNNKVKSGIIDNGFKNKKHTCDSKIKMSESHKNMSHIYQTDEFKEKMSKVTSGCNNAMFGKTFYDVWLQKYGEEQADNLLLKFKEKQSINNTGKNNPMYGKPSPHGSGNGWKGWYNGIFFRSLLELSFLVNYIERFNMIMENGECKKYSVKYTIDNIEKNYFSDYIINEKYMVEVKPKKLHNSYLVQLKKEAAQKYCYENKLIYKLIEPIKIQKKQILELINTGNLIFMEKYLQKVIDY